MSPVVLYEVDGHVATITINRPEQKNAVDPEVTAAMSSIMSEFESDPAVWAGILTGAGDRAFCAGADLKAIVAGQAAEIGAAHPGGFAGFVKFERTKPVIAAVRGYALAGGLELVLACDLAIASDDARFGLPEVRHGLVAAAGGMFRLPRLVPVRRAMEMVLTGEHIDAAEAHRLGLVNHVVPSPEVLAAARSLADRICHNAPLAVRESRAIVRRALDVDEAEGWALSSAAWARIEASEDAREGPRAFAEKRAPRWTAS